MTTSKTQTPKEEQNVDHRHEAHGQGAVGLGGTDKSGTPLTREGHPDHRVDREDTSSNSTRARSNENDDEESNSSRERQHAGSVKGGQNSHSGSGSTR